MSYRTLVKGSLPSPNQFIRDDHLNRIADAFQLLQPRVTTLDLRNCANVTDVAIIHLITAVSAKLRHLNVTNCRHIKDVTVRTIARVCDHLEELVLRGCGKVGDASIREVATYLGPQLKLLDVSGCMRINDPGLDYLAKFSGNYQLIHWEALRLEAAMRPISPAIQSPLLPDTPTTPMAARAASPVHGRPQSPVSPPSSPRPGSPTQQYAQKGVVPRTDGRVGGKLRTLCLPGIRRQSRGGLVVFLTEMASIHPHVHTLEFSIPPPPSTSTKSMFSGGPALFWGLRGLTLTSLTIRDCEYLDDSNLIPIAHYCKQLRSLTLFNAQHMTETAFGTLVSELRHLKATVAYRERHRDPQVTRDIHMANFAVRGLMRDEFDLGTVGSGGSPMLWSIMPATARPNAIWYCRFVRSALRNLLDEYSWIPVPVKVFSVIPASVSAASPPGSP
ncbi:hypothetical protein BCR44DRAFT_118270 [Catenaria anguillulae PL171]|uniref:F-box/LRR-repeat protein 15-like leucin rich repeat domain-containing protein n=1 Tax=Catenaria anguillulae PL171 TaxID=765915 RepID=A0A1Y2HIZ2_9FUNG|nr:hypothetical protein BCR44DRAFT_118270 [Catenaria anguillulae PL171]